MNNPTVRIVMEIGTSYDQVVAETCPLATMLRLKSNNEATLTVQAGRADCQVPVLKRNQHSARWCCRIHCSPPRRRRGCDGTWRDFVDNWIDWNRGLGRMRRMVVDGLRLVGVTESDVPPEVGF